MVRETFDIDFIIQKFPAILSALPVTIEITVISSGAGLDTGNDLGMGKNKRPEMA